MNKLLSFFNKTCGFLYTPFQKHNLSNYTLTNKEKMIGFLIGSYYWSTILVILFYIFLDRNTHGSFHSFLTILSNIILFFGFFIAYFSFKDSNNKPKKKINLIEKDDVIIEDTKKTLLFTSINNAQKIK